MKVLFRLYILWWFKFLLDRKFLEKFYFLFVRLVIEYVDVVWDNILNDLVDKFEKINIEVVCIVLGVIKFVSLNDLYWEVGWDILYNCR